MATLQKQGVPVPDRLQGPRVQRVPQTPRYRASMAAQRAQQRSRPRPRAATNRRVVESEAAGTAVTAREIRKYSPTQAGEKTSGVGLLEAEFFGILFLLILQLFIGGSSTYGDKIMSFMKRGMLTAILFFFLALIAGIGPNASKISKAIGGLVFVGILVSSPGQDIINSLDAFFKSDWVGTSEHGKTTSASADAGTAAGSSGTIQRAENAASNAANTITELQIPGIGPVVGIEKAINALKGFLHL